MATPLLIGIVLSFFFFIGLWLALSRSPLIPDLLEWFVTDEPMTHKDVDNWLICYGKMKLFRLWTCSYCQSFWTAVMHGSVSTLLLCVFTKNHLWAVLWPVIILAFYPVVFYVISKLWKQ